MSRLRSIGVTLFLALLATALCVVVLLVVLFRVSLGAGFTEYVSRLELTRLDRFEQHLQARYRDEGSWQFVRHPQDLLPDGPPPRREDGPPPRRGEGPPPRAGDDPARRGPPGEPRRGGDRLGLGPRVALFDAERRYIMGPPEAASRPMRAMLGPNGQVIGYLALAPVADSGDVLAKHFLESQTTNLLLSALFALLVSALVAFWLARNFRKPILALTEAARQLAAGRLATRVELARRDELGDLGRDFNAMAHKLQRFEQSRRQWVADTSHELRTPLTILRVHTDAMRDGIMPLDQKGLSRLDGAVADLDRLVADLYQLARADVGMHDYHPEPLKVGELLADLLERYREPMRKGGLQLSAAEPPALVVLGDLERLHQLFGNLLANSLRYTDAGGEVRMAARQVGREVEITIEDSAPGVPDIALGKLFERFYRVDASRSRQGGGSGLGLAICQAIVEAHAGSISAAHSPLGGVRIIVTLPLHLGGHS